MMKVEEASGSKCFVQILNHSNSAPPEAVLDASASVLTCVLLCLNLLFVTFLNYRYSLRLG